MKYACLKSQEVSSRKGTKKDLSLYLMGRIVNEILNTIILWSFYGLENVNILKSVIKWWNYTDF